MVARLRAFLASFASETILVANKVFLSLIPGERRRLFVGRLVDLAFRLDSADSFAEHRKLLIDRLVDSAFKVDQAESFNAFIESTSSGELTEAQKERLFRHSCSQFGNTKVPDSAITAFEATCGGVVHYGQEGEDILLEKLLGDRRSGFFVDVGAHHATRFSNTFALYRRGWRGINIDATPGSMESFRRFRPEDTNLEVAVSDNKETLSLSVFKESALNTTDEALARSYAEGGWSLTGTVDLEPRSLAEILEAHLLPGQKIDLLSIDVEGNEMAVLRSNDWDRFCPDTIVIEALDVSMTALHEAPAVVFLAEREFVPLSRLFNSIILRRKARECAES